MPKKKTKVFKPSAVAVNQSGVPDIPDEPKTPTAVNPVMPKTAGPKTSNPLKELPPLQIRAESEFSPVETWDDREYGEISGLRRFIFGTTFMVRAFLPYVLVASLVGGGIYFWEEIQTKVTEFHARLVTELRPKAQEPEPLVQIDEGSENLFEDPTNRDNTKPALQKSNLSQDAASLAMKASVRIAVQGVGTGSGVICDVSGKDALILTNLSLIDQTFWLTGGQKKKDELPTVQLEYSDATRVTGEVVWVAGGGIDLAIVRASGRSENIQPVRPTAADVTIGDAVFYVDSPGSVTERMARTVVVEVNTDDETNGIPVVQVETKDLAVGSGLYNGDGELIAISGGSDILTGGKATAVHLSALRDVDTPSLLDGTLTAK